MLEDPSYSEIVRWGDEGDSFVVLEVIILRARARALRSLPLAIQPRLIRGLGNSAKNSPKPSCPGISSTAISPVSSDN